MNFWIWEDNEKISVLNVGEKIPIRENPHSQVGTDKPAMWQIHMQGSGPGIEPGSTEMKGMDRNHGANPNSSPVHLGDCFNGEKKAWEWLLMDFHILMTSSFDQHLYISYELCRKQPITRTTSNDGPIKETVPLWV